MLKIYTHNGTFHADDVTAVALLEIAKNETAKVVRIGHQETVAFETEVYVIDVAKVYSPVDNRFDHHQITPIKDGSDKAAAGLVLEHLVFTDELVYNDTVSKIVSMVDDNDVGYRKSAVGELSWTIAHLNSEDIYDHDAQLIRFRMAVDLVKTVLNNLYAAQAQEVHTRELLETSNIVLGGKGLFVKEFPKGWNTVIFDVDTLDKVEVVIWYNAETKNYQAQNVPASKGSFAPRGGSINYHQEDAGDMVFVHQGNFFCVAPDEMAMMKYLKNNFN